jgi:hypothetical protein
MACLARIASEAVDPANGSFAALQKRLVLANRPKGGCSIRLSTPPNDAAHFESLTRASVLITAPEADSQYVAEAAGHLPARDVRRS